MPSSSYGNHIRHAWHLLRCAGTRGRSITQLSIGVITPSPQHAVALNGKGVGDATGDALASRDSDQGEEYGKNQECSHGWDLILGGDNTFNAPRIHFLWR